MRILIICFSSVSNVACIVPHLYSLSRKYSNCEFAVLSRDFLQPLFSSLKNVKFIGADIRGNEAGVIGSYKLAKRLLCEKYDVVVDMQRNWQSEFISYLLMMKGVKSIKISLHKKSLYKLIKRGADKSSPVKTIFERQSDVFKKIGLETDDSFIRLPEATEQEKITLNNVYGEKKGTWIGIAPLSTSRGKTLPFKKMKNIIQHFDKRDNTTIFLFGSGDMEKEMLSDWQSLYNHVNAVHTTRFTLKEELMLMANLDVMLSMDSANVHLASLTGIPVVSVWGSTHPYAGFMGWKQDPDNCIGVEFSCRPCTIREDKECKYGDYRCLESIHSEKIINKIEEIIK